LETVEIHVIDDQDEFDMVLRRFHKNRNELLEANKRIKILEQEVRSLRAKLGNDPETGAGAPSWI
jgi:hypothetical protein